MLAGLVITRDVTRPNRRFPLWTSGENRDKDQSEKVDFRWEGTRSSRTRYLLETCDAYAASLHASDSSCALSRQAGT